MQALKGLSFENSDKALEILLKPYWSFEQGMIIDTYKGNRVQKSCQPSSDQENFTMTGFKMGVARKFGALG